jgi:hypothetical protein
MVQIVMMSIGIDNMEEVYAMREVDTKQTRGIPIF